MVQIQPFGDRVVVEIITPDEVVSGGLIVPTSKEKSNKGLVVSVGDGEDAKKIQQGDIVIFQLGTGLKYSTENGDYQVLDVKDIVGKVIKGEE